MTPALIPLTKGYSAIVSPEDYGRLSAFKWCASVKRAGGVYGVSGGRANRQSLHHAVIGKPPEGLVVDHINGNTLDNRRENLRFVTNAENVRNFTRPPRASTGHRNVYVHKSGFTVRVTRQGVRHRGGWHKSLEAAVAARDSLITAVKALEGIQNRMGHNAAMRASA